MIDILVYIKDGSATIPNTDAGNMYENRVRQLVISDNWTEAGLVRSIVLTTPGGATIGPVEITGTDFPLLYQALDAVGPLQFTIYGKVAGAEVHNASGVLRVRTAASELGGVTPETYSDIVSTTIAARDASIAQTGLCLTATTAAEGITGTVQSTYEAAELARDGLYATAENARDVISSTDHVTASADHGTAQSDHSTAGTDHAQALAESVFVAYNAATSYVIGNKVTYLGSSYRCILASTGNLPTNGTYWIVIASKGDTGDAGTITVGSTNTAINGLVAGNGTKISAPTAAQVGALSIPDAGGYFATDTIDGALQEIGLDRAITPINGVVMSNLVTNGDFSNGITGWTDDGAINSAAGNVLSVTGDGTSATPRASQALSLVNGRKYYYTIAARVTNADCTGLLLMHTTSAIAASQSPPIINTWYILSGVFTASTSTMFRIRHNYVDASTANGKIAEVKYVAAIDLTSMFGAGNEPTSLQMDKLMSYFDNSWFNANANITDILQYLISEKASKTQEGWITPTLLNGWVNYGNPESTCQFMKDQMGFVHLKGVVKSGSLSTAIFVLPVGYRPSEILEFPAMSGTGYGRFGVSTVGDVTPAVGLTSIFSLDGCTFKV